MITLGVIKNIIPAIASTNALIAAVCTNEAFKIVTGSAPPVKNYFYYKGMTSIGSETYASGKLEECPICKKPTIIKVSRKDTLGQFLKKVYPGDVGEPSIETDEGTLLSPLNPASYKRLDLTFNQLIEQKDYNEGSEMYISWVEKDKRNQKTVHVRLQD